MRLSLISKKMIFRTNITILTFHLTSYKAHIEFLEINHLKDKARIKIEIDSSTISRKYLDLIWWFKTRLKHNWISTQIWRAWWSFKTKTTVNSISKTQLFQGREAPWDSALKAVECLLAEGYIHQISQFLCKTTSCIKRIIHHSELLKTKCNFNQAWCQGQPRIKTRLP